MNFHVRKLIDRKQLYDVECDISVGEFAEFMHELADLFSGNISFDFATEAELATVSFSSGKIFSRYDLVYGLEFTCVGLSKEELIKFEKFLSIK